MVEIVPHDRFRLIQENSCFLGGPSFSDDFLQKICVISAGGLDQEFGGFCALGWLETCMKGDFGESLYVMDLLLLGLMSWICHAESFIGVYT